ncbi:hypothetical protein L227DRAFT_366914 [Lentinus tigrinus ALCF2SS1-6]|uniref:Uncharacterized protein n=1 Tax=Lentinus tigrinus ALCF2SS1-6 TaxID=1328759 RepID=A0A5C2SJY2_9APHY|nr:hypothetical protein L227DRAFT_366914 [Lentinus tigrinus ALCF2SS1-6]
MSMQRPSSALRDEHRRTASSNHRRPRIHITFLMSSIFGLLRWPPMNAQFHLKGAVPCLPSGCFLRSRTPTALLLYHRRTAHGTPYRVLSRRYRASCLAGLSSSLRAKRILRRVPPLISPDRPLRLPPRRPVQATTHRPLLIHSEFRLNSPAYHSHRKLPSTRTILLGHNCVSQSQRTRPARRHLPRCLPAGNCTRTTAHRSFCVMPCRLSMSPALSLSTATCTATKPSSRTRSLPSRSANRQTPVFRPAGSRRSACEHSHAAASSSSDHPSPSQVRTAAAA